LREHLQAVARSTGRTPPELQVPPLPAACQGVWHLFLELHARRGSNGFGPAPIDEARLCCWQQLHRTQLSPWEVDTIFLLDGVWLRCMHQQQSKPGQQRKT
jgi:hypothetical protein